MLRTHPALVTHMDAKTREATMQKHRDKRAAMIAADIERTTLLQELRALRRARLETTPCSQ